MNIEIMSREELMELAKEPFSTGTAVISITDSDDADVVLEHQPERILRLKFDDVSDEIFEESIPYAQQCPNPADSRLCTKYAQGRHVDLPV